MPVKDSAYYNCDPNDNPYLNWTCYADGDCGQEFGTPGTRNLTVYIPAGYEDNGNEVAVMVTQDHAGFGTDGGPKITNIMDSLINAQDDERSLPFFVLVAVQLAGPGAMAAPPCGGSFEGSVRSYEYMTFSTDYAHFVSDEVLPFVTNHPDIKTKYPNLSFTNDPAGRASFGMSDGGATAINMAFSTPSLFGIAIGYNAGLVDHRYPSQPSKLEYPKDYAELWVPETEGGQALIKNENLKPIRIFHSASEKDFGTPSACAFLPGVGDYDFPSTQNNNFLEANNKTHVALTEKGYETRYMYALNQCHTDPPSLFQDLPNTLVWAWADWKVQQDKAVDTSSAFAPSIKWMILFFLPIVGM